MHFTSHHKIIERMHQFWDSCRVVPPVEIKYIDIIRLELLQTVVETFLHALRPSPSPIALTPILLPVIELVGTAILRSYHQTIPIVARSHPFTQPYLGLFVLIYAGRVNEITSGGDESVKNFEMSD